MNTVMDPGDKIVDVVVIFWLMSVFTKNWNPPPGSPRDPELPELPIAPVDPLGPPSPVGPVNPVAPVGP
jgi:hypothetical protein